MNHALHIFAGNIELAALHCATTDKNGVVIFFQFIKGNVFADTGIQMNFHTEIFNNLNFRVENIFG